ncbi:MAG: hypothetical protein HUJ18_03195 [Marinobacter sp.]|nr:hypothetical protein [Marinobacter sp.]
MTKHVNKTALLTATLVSGAMMAGTALAGNHGMNAARVWADDQSVAAGTVTAKKVNAEMNGWLVVHRTDEDMKPGPVVGHAPLKKGKNMDVAAILTEDVKPGDMLMLMVHGEDGGMKTGTFEYTLGAKEDGPVRKDGKLVMTTITAN